MKLSTSNLPFLVKLIMITSGLTTMAKFYKIWKMTRNEQDPILFSLTKDARELAKLIADSYALYPIKCLRPLGSNLFYQL